MKIWIFALAHLIFSLEHPAELVFETGRSYNMTATGFYSFHLDYPVAVTVTGRDSFSLQGNDCTCIGEGKYT